MILRFNKRLYTSVQHQTVVQKQSKQNNTIIRIYSSIC